MHYFFDTWTIDFSCKMEAIRNGEDPGIIELSDYESSDMQLNLM